MSIGTEKKITTQNNPFFVSCKVAMHLQKEGSHTPESPNWHT